MAQWICSTELRLVPDTCSKDCAKSGSFCFNFSYAAFHNASADQGGRVGFCRDEMGTESTLEGGTVEEGGFEGTVIEGATAGVVGGGSVLLFPCLEALLFL